MGTIVLHQGTSAAKKAFDKGLDSVGKGKNDDAEKNFEKAVGIYPQYADAWLNLGKLRLQRFWRPGKTSAARRKHCAHT